MTFHPHSVVEGTLPGPTNQPGQASQQSNVGSSTSANDAPCDAILLDLHVIHHIPSVEEFVNGILVAYETQVKQIASQSKLHLRHSGCYNTMDAVTENPEIRWPIEGQETCNS